jgi:hypothetical protein
MSPLRNFLKNNHKYTLNVETEASDVSESCQIHNQINSQTNNIDKEQPKNKNKLLDLK